MAEDHHPEIVIVKRHAKHVDEHHGGAWKIAFADFMTAMMALFLVLWLISSTSEKQKRAVAQYFNPVKLVDMTTVEKGFHDSKETDLGAGIATDPTQSEKGARDSRSVSAEPRAERPKDSTTAAKAAENPAMRLAEHRDEKARRGQAPNRDELGEFVVNPVGLAEPSAAASAFADPFATVPDELRAADEREWQETENRFSSASSSRQTTPGAASRPEQPQGSVRRASRSEAAAPDAMPPFAARAASDADAAALASEMRDGAASDLAKEAAPKIEVRVTEEGILISLTDAVDDRMFSIGSAEPHRRTIEVIQKIARSLATRPGTIVIRGHTDARPYRSGTSDNWRLSTARAHAARDVLVRGGLGEGRIERVEGYADRSPKLAGDPTAPENRRIEILLRKGRG